LPAAKAAGISSGWRKPSEEIWLSASRGLRGSFQALSGARKQDLDALEPRPTDNEIKKLKQVEN